jgi:hypothetical protein
VGVFCPFTRPNFGFRGFRGYVCRRKGCNRSNTNETVRDLSWKVSSHRKTHAIKSSATESSRNLDPEKQPWQDQPKDTSLDGAGHDEEYWMAFYCLEMLSYGKRVAENC